MARAKVGYLGPEGTFTEEALLGSALPGAVEPVAMRTIFEAVTALRDGELDWAVVPIENSLDGSVSVTLDLLGGEEGGLQIAGEAQLSVRHSLIAAAPTPIAEIETVLTHPQVPGQCERLLHGELARARVLAASSTAEAVRTVVASGRRGEAALGTALAAEIYGGTVIRDGVQDRDDNETRFVWLARATADAEQTEPPLRDAADAADGEDREGGDGGASPGGEAAHDSVAARRGADERPAAVWKTSLVFWGAGADSPGWLVRCLNEFGSRDINLTKIESRPKRERMGSYMFFVDLQGRVGEKRVDEAIDGLRAICEQVRVLGSYRRALPSRRRVSSTPLHSGSAHG